MRLNVQFASLSVGPKAFCAKSQTGWPEMYQRKDCDCELRKWLTPLDADEVIDAFIAIQQSKRSEFPKRATTWGDVLEFLGRIKNVRAENIPGIVGVALWGFSEVREEDMRNGGN